VKGTHNNKADGNRGKLNAAAISGFLKLFDYSPINNPFIDTHTNMHS